MIIIFNVPTTPVHHQSRLIQQIIIQKKPLAMIDWRLLGDIAITGYTYSVNMSKYNMISFVGQIAFFPFKCR